jgi:hypothetical protein
MATRSKETTLTFSKAFALSEVDRQLPAGTYRVVVDEEDIPGLSFLAFKAANSVEIEEHQPAPDMLRQ